MFLCRVTCNVWLGQIYPNDILLLDALLSLLVRTLFRPESAGSEDDLLTFTFTFMHLADAFIQSDLHCIQVTVLHLISSCFPWESNP